MMLKLKSLALGAALLAASAGSSAALSFDANVTNNVIVGSGVTNGGFTVDTAQGIELGLRARERYVDPVAGLYGPTNDTNSNGDGSYSHVTGGFTPAGGASGTSPGPLASWNFDWSINTGTAPVGSYFYRLGLDFDPGVGTAFVSFDLINGQPYFDHSFGNNGTAQSAGVEAVDALTYAALKAGNNLVQNSWNLGFFGQPFDPNADGNYAIYLEAISTGGDVLARSDIEVIVGAGAVPEPGSLALVGLALAGIGLARRRRAA